MSRLGHYIAVGNVSERITTAEAAESIGIKTKTLAAITRGGKCDGPTLAKIMTWLIQVEAVPAPTSESDIPVSGGPAARAHDKAREVSRGVGT